MPSSNSSGVVSGAPGAHKQTSLKLLKMHMKVVNLAEENEKLQTELASKEIHFAQRLEEMSERLQKARASEDALKKQCQETMKKHQKVLLDSELAKQQLSENEVRLAELRRCVSQTKQDLQFLLTSAQIKQFGS